MPGHVFTRRRLLAVLGLGGAMTVTDFADWNAPQGHATAIAGTGAPLLNLHTQQASQSNQSLSPGAQILGSQIAVNQPGYLLFLGARVSGGSPAGPVTVQLNWSDSASGVATGQKRYAIWPSSTGTGHSIAAYGRTRGNQVSYTIVNTSSGATVLATVVLVATSVPFTADRAISTSSPALASGNTAGQYDLASGIIGANDINTLGAAGVRTDDLGLYQGKVSLYAQTASGTTDLTVQVQAAADTLVTGQAQTLFKGVSGAKGTLAAEIELPGAQCSVTVTNGNAGAQRVNYQLAAEDL